MRVSNKSMKKAGLPPESLFYTGEQTSSEVRMTLFNYDDARFEKRSLDDLSKIYEAKNQPGVKWINVDGVHDVDVVESIGLQYGIHFLVLEDIMDINQRPKIEDHEKYLYIVVRMLYADDKTGKVISEQVSMILTEDTVITFQEQIGYDVFGSIRNRIVQSKGRIRREGADFLLYSMLDAIVDNYFTVMEDISEEIAVLERQLLTSPGSEVLGDIYNLKMDIIYLRNSVWPVREVIMQIQKMDTDLIRDSLQPYFKDIYDHILQALDSIKVYNDTIVGMLDIYSSSVNNKTNEVMRRLTVITTVFGPLTVISGIGGMSEFSAMTGGEKNWPVAYGIFFIGMFIIGYITYQIIRRSYMYMDQPIKKKK